MEMFHAQLLAKGFRYLGDQDPMNNMLAIPSVANPLQYSHYSKAVVREMEQDTFFRIQVAEEAQNQATGERVTIEIEQRQQQMWELAFDSSLPECDKDNFEQQLINRVQPLSIETSKLCVNGFQEKMKPDRPLATCACCGKRDFNTEVLPVPISSLSLLQLNFSQILAYKSLPLHSAYSVTELIDVYGFPAYYYLHREFVNAATNEAKLCLKCRKKLSKNQLPKYCIATGYDLEASKG